LDPDPERLPEPLSRPESLTESVLAFCLDIQEATREVACAYKINFAFFEALGAQGWTILQELVAAIPDSKIKIADAKRGDIGNTGRFYAEAILDHMGFDACTVSPYMGRSSVEPFLKYRGKAAFVLARTSNPDAREIQDWPTPDTALYRHVARSAITWADGQHGDVGLVVGATDTKAMSALRGDCPSTPFLVPGVGAQGGDLAGVLRAGFADAGSLTINSSRSILYASQQSDYAQAAERAASKLRDEINRLKSA
jgi:orotidine-5'-phosphate decarboxylase